MSDNTEALRLAAQLEDTESARLHLMPYAAAELRRLHAENEALKAEYAQLRDYMDALNERCIDDTALIGELVKAPHYIEGVALADEWRDLPGIAETARTALAKVESSNGS